MHLIGILGILCCWIAETYGQAGTCRSTPDRFLYPCGNSEKSGRSSCGRSSVLGRRCCFRPNRGCLVDSRGLGLGINNLREFAQKVKVPTPPDRSKLPGIIQRIPVSGAAVQKGLGRVNPRFRQNALRRSLSLGILLGTGGIANIFPRCPVHVKLCYRVPCGGFGGNNDYLDKNPGECLKDPTCCYDYELALFKTVFGPNVMGGAPTCYTGPTSQQWRFITSFFKPWNVWYTNFIIQAFEGVFNTKAFNIGGQFLCRFNFQEKNYPVGQKSELECNLVSGCWDSSRPVGKQCTMASSIIKDIFGGFVSDQAIYPSLYTDDFEDTQCASNWIDYGPKAYRRMECDVKTEPDEFNKKILEWCPYRDCCLNYAAFSASQIAQISLLTSLGGGGVPIGGGILPLAGGLPSIGSAGSIFGNAFNQRGQPSTLSNRNLLYLFAASSASSSFDLEKLFCPYRNIFSAFIDLSESTEGCCDIPRCYHKKQYVRRSGPVTPKPTSPPVIFPPFYPGNWGNWGSCNAQCNRQGTRSRACYVNGRSSSSSDCSGSATESCSGPPCQATYTWGEWTSSRCSVTCGSGTLTYSRSCKDSFGRTVPSSYCQGGENSGTSTATCNTNPCPRPVSYTWGSWTSSGCSATCGGGTLTYSRPCRNNFGQTVSSSLCDGGSSSGTSTASCNNDPCPLPAVFYSWTEWTSSGCSVSCGSGYITYNRQCQNNYGLEVSAAFCTGRNRQTVSCSEECRVNYQWSGSYVRETGCSRRCGFGTERYVQQCIESRTREVVPAFYCSGIQPTATHACYGRQCRPLFG